MVLGALTCGKSKSPVTATSGAALHIVSAPVHAAQVGNQTSYQAVLSQPGAAEWTMNQGPHGASIDEGGTVTWTPDATQGGDQAFTVSATMNGHTVTQTFQVTAASSVVEASAHVDPSDPNGGTVAVDAPLSSVQGTAVQVDPGALPPGQPVAVSISSMQHAPMPPAAQVAGVKPQDLDPVEVGPSGLTFKKPARLQLPIPPRLMTMPNLTVQTYDYRSGQWKRVHVLSVDKTAGVAVAEIEHFSTYVVTPDVPVIDLKLGLGGPACAGALVVRAPLAAGFADIPAAAVNGYAGAAGTVADVLASMTAGQALQVYTRVQARAAAATGEQSGWLLAAATRQDDGTFLVSVTSDSHAGAFLTLPAKGLAATDPELLAWMNGARADLVFGALGDLTGGAVANAEVSLYLVPAADASHAPPASANAFGTEDAAVTSLAAVSVPDTDCDGAPDAWDPEPAGTPPPVLVGIPGSPVHVAVGAGAPFKISSPQDGVSFTWAASDPSVTVVTAMGGAVAMATPSLAGLFHLTATGTRAGASSIYAWDVIADPPSVTAANTPPFVAVSASANIVRAGEAVTLTAFGKDAQQAALTYVWTATDASALSAKAGGAVVFLSMTPGDYVVTCVANDGSANSPPASVTLTVLSATANRPPDAPSVSPLSAALPHDAGAAVSLVLAALADDPDGDALTYDFEPDPATPPTFTLMKSGASATFTSSQDGVYVFYVTATDANGARGPWAPVKILVLPRLAAQPIDADHDGFPAGFDCDDADPTVHPGAKEICGDGKDQDCDGRDLPTDQCDADGDRFSPAEGDCDDNNPAIGPQVAERCDGVDNNCNGVVDEGFGVGAACTAGVGACQVEGKTACSASFVGVVCRGLVGAPQPEVCDGLDNDCNGRIDDVPGFDMSGDTQSCGGCGIACPTRPNGVAACVMGGCVAVCAAGFVDTDRNAANGCECKLTNNGIEICDGVDNDCNGAVDDGVGAVNYPGPAGTIGVGVCAAGLEICQGGRLVQMVPPRLPSPEICDGLDNDCNGKVDDGFDLLGDSKNCGGCGLVCAPGTQCQQGKCPIVTGGDGGVGPGPDGGVGPGPDGGVGPGPGGGVGPGLDGGVGPGGMLGLCQNATGGSSCTDLSNDHASCGACGHACAATQYCQGGVCTDYPAMTCGAGMTTCLDPAGQKPFCTSLLNDPRNCNACGNVCQNGAGCMNGVCVGGSDAGTAASPDGGDTTSASCPGGGGLCTGAGGSMYCASFSYGTADCGACGHACAAGQYCANGTCLLAGAGTACGQGQSSCPNATGNGVYCVDLTTDPSNCGACARMCPGGTRCAAGICAALTCAPPGTACVGAGGSTICTDLTRDAANCGACGKVCATNAICSAGVCEGGGGSYPGLAACTGPGGAAFCTNLLNDQGNCGACGNMCAAGESCFGGTCGTAPPPPVCPTGTVVCTDPSGQKQYCSNPTFDSGNCGRCGNVCASGTSCNNGACVTTAMTDAGTLQCGPAMKMCANAAGMYCADVVNDFANCGMCGLQCPGGWFCQNGSCMAQDGGTAPPPDGGFPPVNCAAGYSACYPAAGPGYCTNFSDPGNCGGCFRACPGGYSCQAAICMPPPDGGTAPDGGGVSCNPPAVACDGTYCADVTTDIGNCGACHIMCSAAQQCLQGKCM
ncbi:MAG TPA: MopE-related protein [Polyangia bacterium]|nr:MopE-related protein [Polyangia bacterium]